MAVRPTNPVPSSSAEAPRKLLRDSQYHIAVIIATVASLVMIIAIILGLAMSALGCGRVSMERAYAQKSRSTRCP